MADSKHEPDDDEEDDGEDLPVKLPAKSKPVPSKFGPLAIDYAVNQKLQDLIPKTANTATVSVRIRSHGEERILTGVAAFRAGQVWGLDLGAAVGAAVDLNNHRNYEVEFLGVVSWK